MEKLTGTVTVLAILVLGLGIAVLAVGALEGDNFLQTIGIIDAFIGMIALIIAVIAHTRITHKE